MSDPRKLAAKMTDRPIDYAGVPGGDPGRGLTGLDISGAMAMGGANRKEAMVVRLKWVQDTSVMTSLLYEIMLDVVDIAISEQWRVPKGADFLRRITRMAVLELCDPMICPTCKGRAFAKINHKVVICDTCNGRGRKPWSDGMRARAIGIDKSNWSRVWSGRYNKIVARVQKLEIGGLYAISNGLEGEP